MMEFITNLLDLIVEFICGVVEGAYIAVYSVKEMIEAGDTIMTALVIILAVVTVLLVLDIIHYAILKRLMKS